MKTFSYTIYLLIFIGFLVAGCGGSRPVSQNSEDVTVKSSAVTPVQYDSSIVAVYDDHTITLDEFEVQYVRSVGDLNTAVADSLQDYKDFLERYVDFRLKVRAAKAAGLDTVESIQQEFNTYRLNLARPRLLEKEVMEPAMQEIFSRMQKTIDVSHILVRVDPNAPATDTLAAYEKMVVILDSIQAGADFGEIAFRNSDDPSAKNVGGVGHNGRIGFFSAGQMVPEFEQIAFNSAIGEISPIFRTQFGYHILKVHDIQQAVPGVRIAHIMITPEGDDSTAAINARAQLSEIIDEIKAGADFSQLAKQHSDHEPSAQRGGEIGWFNYYRPQMAPTGFHSAAFALKNIGDMSGIVKTPYGFHVLKLVDRQQLDNYEAIEEQLRRYVAQLPMTRNAEANLAKRVLDKLGYTVNSNFLQKTFSDTQKDSLYLSIADGNFSHEALQTPVATLGDSTFLFTDIIQFVRTQRPRPVGETEEQIQSLLDKFMNEKAIDYEAALLETRDKEFERILSEFHDGLLLFKVMEDSVWNAAASDSIALRSFYEQHIDSYRFPDRTRIIAFRSRSDSLISDIASRLDGGNSVAAIQKEISRDSTRQVWSDTVFVANSTNSFYDRALSLEVGKNTGLIAYQNERLVLVNDGIEPARGKTFEEARAEVLSGFQNVLETRLIERLRQRYAVQTFPDRLSKAFEDQKPVETALGK